MQQPPAPLTLTLRMTCGRLLFADASLSHIDVEGTIQTVEENRDVIVGIKVLLSRPYATGTMVRGEEPAGENEAQTWASAQEAAARANVPLMTHHSWSSIPLEECPGALRPGDIYTRA